MSSLPEEWKEELARLRAERDLAFRNMVSHQKSLDELTRMVAAQNERLDQLLSMLRRREAQLRRSEAENRKLRRQLGLDEPDPDPVAEAVPPSPATEGLEGTAETAASESTGEASRLPRRKSRPRTRGGRRPPPDHLPADVERHEACLCGHCGGRGLKRDVLTTTVYTVVVMKFVLLVPLDRIRELLRTQGVDIAMGTLVHLVKRAAELVDPIDGEHMKQLKAGAYMHFDGTGLKALVAGQAQAWDGCGDPEQGRCARGGPGALQRAPPPEAPRR